jgi:argininosuccinate lyase
MSGAELEEVAASRRAEEALEIGARLGAPPTPTLVETAFAAELEDQRPLAAGLDLADLAHAVMTVETGIVPAAPGGALLAALLELQAHPQALRADPALGDLYTNREAWLAERTPAAGWLGAGRARREATTVAYQLTVRAGLLRLAGALVELGRALARRALELRDALVPDYTYLRAAQPSSLGHTLLAPAQGVLRDLDRLRALHRRLDRCPAGCGSANGSRLPQDRRRLAALLGFEGAAEHARDAMWQADLALEATGVVAAAMINGDRLAEDLLFLSAEEVGLVELADGHARASKILPQKRNPYALAHVRAVTHRALGAQAAVASAGRTPSGQLDSRLVAYAEVPRALAASAGALRLLAEVVGGLRHDPARGAAVLAAGQTWSTDLAEVLVLEGGLDYRAAHRAVGTLVRELPPGSGAAAVTAERLCAVAGRLEGRPVHVTPASVAQALDPRQAVLERSGPGGAAPEEVQAMAWRCESALLEHEAWRARAEQRAGEAARALGERARALAGQG